MTNPIVAPTQSRLATGRVVVVASSAGGLGALGIMLRGLPTEFAAPVVIVQHLAPSYPEPTWPCCSSDTPPLRVKEAEDDELLRAGTIYLAPPDRHLLVGAGGRLALSDAPPVRFLRPAADLLFQSAADWYKEHTIAVVLTGTGTDGTAGVRAVKQVGGTVIAQDKATAEFFGMPESAIATRTVDLVLPLGAIASALDELVGKGRAS